MENIYDVLIVGGGISGLYLNYKLLKSKKCRKTLLVEKYDVLGGRIQTKHVSFKGKKHIMEAGAGRFNSNHKLLLKLIKKFKLESKIILLNSKYQVLTVKKRWENSELAEYLPYQILDHIFKKVTLKKSMKKQSFGEWLKKSIEKEVFDYIYDTYPYNDIFKINAYDAIKLYKIDLNINNKFYILSGGLSQIVKCLQKEILDMGGIIKTSTECTGYNKLSNNIYNCKLGKEEIVSKNIVFTIQRPDLLKIHKLKPVKNLINSVHNANLLRVYAIFPTTKKCSWFKNISKVLTDSPLSYFIPINQKNGLAMLSYTDDNRAKNLMRISQKNGKKALGKYLVDECKKIFKTNDIPYPVWLETYYWKNGVGDWKKNNDSSIVSKKIQKPFKKENVFICGENYSENYQCWIEGGLETAEKVYKMF